MTGFNPRSSLALVLKVLNTKREGLSARQLEKEIPEVYAFETLKVIITRLVRLGYIQNLGKTHCEGCGARANRYRITPKGRQTLQEYA